MLDLPEYPVLTDLGTLIAAIVVGVIAGLLAGKQEDDIVKRQAADAGNEQASDQYAKEYWEDALWGLAGSFIGIGLNIEIWMIPIAGYASRRLIPLLADGLIDAVERAMKIQKK